jgi:hypothetical protein
MNTETIRQGLRNMRTRAVTINAVCTQGAKMTEAVVPLLQDRHDGVRWSAIKILSEIGDNTAIPALITLLEQHRNTTDAVNALCMITGQELGDSPVEWREWLLKSADGNAGAAGMLSDRDLITEATRDMNAVISGESPHFGVLVSLPDGRSQQIWIDFTRTGSDDSPLVQLSTPCGQAIPSQYAEALRLNMLIPFGALAIADIDGTEHLVIVDTYRRATVHPEILADAIQSLAQHGDSVEQSINPDDQF